ncbi:hypothetical protein CERZMDRAFT_48953 [Cercospora zeae-maydis SCOH1-5]|uniref:Cdc23 domain-containing protein n=1 Tax=Cercospora zeae-maydis SCOH1-5 TaxID=717836 RepID=A0A6A6F2B2_9PEZI|nr:hypothetical protein CERZMDRAFT_48953 [Cercospora zeae-maydis SCOH1-5]
MLSGDQEAELVGKLQQAIAACNERCLYFAAQWSAELLNSFEDPIEAVEGDGSDTEIDDDEPPVPTIQTSNRDSKEVRREAKELRRYLMAKSFFDCREFDRCAAVFLPSQLAHAAPSYETLHPSDTPKNLSQKSLFLALYARYLSGEKRKNEESETILGPHDGPLTANKEVPGVATVLEEYFNARGGLQDLTNSDGWLDYLYGIILIKSKSERLAMQWLLRSVNLNPWNWSAWLELASLIETAEQLDDTFKASLPKNIMTFIFIIYCSQELFQQDQQVFDTLTRMLDIFPRSAFLIQQKALLLYHMRDYDAATSLFEDLLRRFPHRLDAMEIYSNLLYVLQNRPKLATLAAMASDTDKFRPETNCILGNYYSLIGEHEKAVLHFRRALALDRNCQTAWTLMGHEYIELKNNQAAIESYRRAVDTNRKDYRAWYGLGQGYEMLECHSYSLFYYQRAAALYPLDPKMWAAVGHAYNRCNKVANAIQSFKRALIAGAQMDTGSSFGSSNADPLAQAVGGALDPQILWEIACLYEQQSNWEEAAAYMELTLAQEEGAEEGEDGLGVTQITSRARLWLARWSHTCGDWQRTMDLANELCQDGIEVEEAKSLIKDVRAQLQEMGEDGSTRRTHNRGSEEL